MTRHVDDFIDDSASDPYAASWLESFRRPALDKLEKPDERKLYATYEGKRYLVTGCSRMGDVWLHSDLAYTGWSYQKRVDVDACSEWSANAGVEAAAEVGNKTDTDGCVGPLPSKLREITEMAELIEKARALGPMTDEQRREQAASFAFGQLALTKEWCDKSAPELAKLRAICREAAGCTAESNSHLHHKGDQ